MTIEYIPASGFLIDSISINWSESREIIREKLNQKHIVDDKIIELAQYFDGDESQNIYQHRDIYENFNSTENYFFLSYDENGLFSELEIHKGMKIKIYEDVLEFETPIEIVLDKLSIYDNTIKETDDGNYLLPKLKIALATSEVMGGVGNGFSYFYSGRSVDHLIE